MFSGSKASSYFSVSALKTTNSAIVVPTEIFKNNSLNLVLISLFTFDLLPVSKPNFQASHDGLWSHNLSCYLKHMFNFNTFTSSTI